MLFIWTIYVHSYCHIFKFLLQDVGQSILESYSRVMESLAFNIMARIDDVLYVDDATKRCDTARIDDVLHLQLRHSVLPSPCPKPR